MQNVTQPLESSDLFGRMISILEAAQTHVLRSFNSEMVIADWLIGREFIEEIQAGDEKAAYSRQPINSLSNQLNKRLGKDFPTTNFWYFPGFYLAFPGRNAVSGATD